MKTQNLLVLFLLILVSCSGKAPSKASFKLDVSGLPLSSTQGGLVLFGKSTAGDNFTRVLQTSLGSGTIQEELPKGTWSFGAVAWDGSGPNGQKPFTGTIRCGFSTASLQSDVATVTLSLSNERCFASDVALAGSYGVSVPKKFHSLSSADICDGDVSAKGVSFCTYSPTIKPIEKGFAGSYRLLVKAGKKFGGQTSSLPGEFLESDCYNTSSNGEPVPVLPSYTASEMNVPAFLQSVGFPLQAVVYLGSACEPGKGSLPRSFLDPSQVKLYPNSSSIFFHVNVPTASLCPLSMSMGNTTSPAAGNGDSSNPWLICTEEQLHALQVNIDGVFGPYDRPVRDGKYVLGRDLNLMKFIQAGPGSTPIHSCVGEGDTFLPIGKYYDSYPACNPMVATPSSSFQFDGNGHTIHHFRYKYSNDNRVGFIGDLMGGIYDLTLERADIEASSFAGALVGYASGSAIISNVKVKNSSVRGTDSVGGIVGILDDIQDVSMVFGENLEVEGKSMTGGLFGQSVSVALSSVSFSGNIHADSGQNYVGGIIGKLSGGVSITEAAASGVLRGGGMYMGGISGEAAFISYARSEMHIVDDNPNTGGARYIGGIVGSQGSYGTDRSFFDGTISTVCSGPGCKIGVITGMGVGPTYSYSNFLIPVAGSNGSGGQNGDMTLYALNGAMYNELDLNSSLCAGASPCQWVKTYGSKPRLASFEDGPGKTPYCATSPNFLTLAAQAASPYFRGTVTDPLVICTPTQFLEVDDAGVSGKHFVLADNINLNEYLMGELSTFSGKLDGKGHYLSGFWNFSATTESALFTSIAPGAILRNLKLFSFRLEPACISSCKVAPLAVTNAGLLSFVDVESSRVYPLTSNGLTGGLVGTNALTGIIEHSRVGTELIANGGGGGVVFTNLGTIRQSLYHGRVDGNNFNTPNQFIGGISAINSGTISRSKFRGVLDRLQYAFKVGGITAEASASSTLSDNEVSNRAVIFGEYYDGTQYVGAIAGASVPGSSFVRNLVQGTVIVTPSHTQGPISGTGDSSGTFTANLSLTVPQQALESSEMASNYSYDSGTKICQVDVTQSLGNGVVISSGMLISSASGKYFHGILDDQGTKYVFSTFMPDGGECSSLIGSVAVFKGIVSPDDLNISELKNSGWDIVVKSEPLEVSRAYSAYKTWFQGGVPTNPPVWLFDEDGDGLELFLFND